MEAPGLKACLSKCVDRTIVSRHAERAVNTITAGLFWAPPPQTNWPLPPKDVFRALGEVVILLAPVIIAPTICYLYVLFLLRKRSLKHQYESYSKQQVQKRKITWQAFEERMMEERMLSDRIKGEED
ncbi:hypothetical protein BU26DRAFT_164340 [Trematosphaeria pertusa]|uniref:Uncharacterized protein n=1 Tax=Trematosphaeria pertusa TaxID=390896 RepID=A0A6A6HWE6_9PLEO|nr:uncharacterized protein BU26DRAFT_164340 [Trematosphaeria pertusa]KAF2242052.1 hypothetical protein BU26DRAFT_164340 [Trematosphaeria pertusa]